MKKYIYMGIAALALTSCNDFLDKEPLDFGSSESYYKTENDLKIATNAFYEYLPINGTGSANTGLYADDSSSDNQIKGAPDVLFYYGNKRVDNVNNVPGNIVNTNWDFAHFRGINFFFQKVEENKNIIKGAESFINHYIGEAYFFRAWEHFRLLRYFGDAPIVTELLPDDVQILAQASKRRPRNEVARFILEDLDNAIELMMDEPIEKGRLTKSAAYALKSRVALYEATWEKYHAGTCFVPGNDKWPGKAYWPDFAWPAGSAEAEINFFLDQAIDASEKAVAGHDLASDYMSLFNVEDLSGNSEVILARYYMNGVSMHNCSYYLKAGGGCNVTRQAIATFLMQNGLPIYAANSGYHGDDTSYAELMDRDPRIAGQRNADGTYPRNPNYTKNQTDNYKFTGFGVVRAAGFIKGAEETDTVFYYKPSIDKTGQDKATTGYEVNKWVNFDSQQLLQNGCTTAVPIFRSAECMLNYMEAYYERHGNLGGNCDQYWKALRNRSGVDADYMKTIAATDMSQESVTDFGANSRGSLVDATLYNIRRERRCELLAEGRRLDDLKRWRALDTMVGWQPEGIKLWAGMNAMYTQTELNTGISTSSVSEYIRPLQAYATGLAYNGYTFPKPHYLEPIPVSEFLLTIDTSTGKSTLYQNPGWPTDNAGLCDPSYNCD
ncbi:MAG: RagB/SusD family nutrient uptake outer membrane protein [Muribaculaceae bacterium]|nr:RagB/SusD family nutrient uptake outer membrane protein [Muribaculaceae bacterium]